MTSEPLTASSAAFYITHCRHGLDLRLNPRCYLCRPLDAERERMKGLVEAAREMAQAYTDIEAPGLLNGRTDQAHDRLRAALAEWEAP